MDKPDLMEDQILKIAMQTVYFRRRNELGTLLAEGDEKTLDDIAGEITHTAVQFQSIVNAAVNRLQENPQ